MLQIHSSLGIFQFQRIPSVSRLRLLIDQFKDSGSGYQSVLKLCDNAGYLIKGFGILIRIAQKAGELAYRDHSPNRSVCACDSNGRIDHAIDKPGGRVGN